MRALTAWTLGWLVLVSVLQAETVVQQARQLENKGDPAAARLVLQRAVEGASSGLEELRAYAEFLDRYHDPGARLAYEKVLATLRGRKDAPETAAVARRLVLLSLIEGDRPAAARYLAIYRTAGGRDWPLATGVDKRHLPPAAENFIEIPGPLASFARMAAISQDVKPEELLLALARNVVTSGYQAAGGAETLEPTEYLKLLIRYVSQARELQKLAGPEKTIRLTACDSTETGELLRILGYRIRGGCGSEVVLETVNASRAFLTIDSGFPLAQLEQSLRTNRPFVYPFQPTRIPVTYDVSYWREGAEKQEGEFIDAFLADPALCRLYLGLAKLDTETADALRKAAPIQRLKAFSHVLDFFGGFFAVRGGKAVVPGGARSARAWEELVGVPIERGGAFFERLITKDDGWMASYFDVLARLQGPARDYLTEPERLKRFYLAIRGRVTSPGPARPVFRANADLILLTSGLHLDLTGQPHIPGGLEIWKDLFLKGFQLRYDRNLIRSASGWKKPEDLLEAMFSLCRRAVDNQPLKVFMALSDLDTARAKPLEPATMQRLAREYRDRGAQYTIFTEVSSLSDKTILQFLDTARNIDDIHDNLHKADAAGIMQALVGLWQIFCRQGSIAETTADQTLASLLSAFADLRQPEEIFDAGRSGVEVLLKATGLPAGTPPQDRLVDLLAGIGETVDAQVHGQMVQEINRIFDAQRLVSLNVLFAIADHLDGLARNESLNSALLNRLEVIVNEIQQPGTTLAAVERTTASFGYYSDRHIEIERKLNLRSAVERAIRHPEKLREIRGSLTPFLRDSLVGLNYAYYAPPGAQVLYANPGFVRSHDFIGLQGMKMTWRATELFGTGWPSSAGGRLTGSLASLPYVLAEAEQNFLVPAREQALIWSDLVPQMLISSRISRWWNVTPAQLHWVGLHMRYAETLLAEAVLAPSVRERLVQLLEWRVSPARIAKISQLLSTADVPGAFELLTPSEAYWLAQQWLTSSPASSDLVPVEIHRLAVESPLVVNQQAISRAFGTPKPTLGHSYRRQLLHLPTFPTLMGYSSRIMAESWESDMLYWAALADQLHLAPSQLNILIPQWTQKTIERIFATHLEDWPALLRSLRAVGEEIRSKTGAQLGAEQKAALN